MTTILDRLRTHARANSGQFQVCLSIAEIREIVGDLERLGAEVARKDAALKPFAAIPPVVYSELTDMPLYAAHYWAVVGHPDKSHFTREDLAAVRAALAPLSSPAEVAAFIDSMDGGTKRIEG